MKKGKVYLVGAGPGDLGLITLKGLDCLTKADVIIYDRLLSEQLLESASPEAERIYVGKEAKHHAVKQFEINQILVTKANEGKNVVRLKGGDPFIMGRGGEEAETLVNNGIPFEVVPGISSAIAVPAYAGIPVTHRSMASSFAVITGHEDPTKTRSSIAWEKLATAVDTLIFLMGMQNLSEIVAQLIKYGRPLGTPVAVIKDGTSPNQKAIVGNLNNIVAKVEENHLTTPAVIIIGEVAHLRKKLRWFDNRPLFGKRILVTRARHQASVLSKLLSEQGALPIELPTIDIKEATDTPEFEQTLSNLKQYHWVIFTSINGVEAFFQKLCDRHLDTRVLGGLKIAAIGPATAEALKTRGIISDFIPKVYTSQGIIRGLSQRNITRQSFLLPRADTANQELIEGITRLGNEARELTMYRTVKAKDTAARVKQAILSSEIDVVTFTSSSTVSNLVSALDNESKAINGAKIACIGPVTADTAVRAGLNVDILAVEHTIPGLASAIEDYYRKEA